MTSVIWSRAAASDLHRICVMIAVHDPAAAGRLVEAIDARIALLRTFPEIGTVSAHGTRKLTIGRYPYMLSYDVAPSAIRILAIRHMAMWPR